MFDSKMLLPVVGQGFVELGVFFAGYVISVPRPDRLGLVQLLLLRVLLLDGLLLRLLLSFSIPIFSNIFNLGLIFLSFLLLLLLLFLVSSSSPFPLLSHLLWAPSIPSTCRFSGTSAAY